ncbi:MAG: hypothetical protein ABSA63_09065 [Thermoplasmata archaeon]|jgi:hypothetical protein
MAIPISAIISSALRSAGDGQRAISIPHGEYLVDQTSTVPSNTSIFFDDVVVRAKTPTLFLKTLAGTSGVKLRGKLTYDGGGNLANAIVFNKTRDVTVQLDAGVQGLPPLRGFILCDQCDSVKVSGTFQSTDSRLFHAVDTNDVEVSGVNAGPYRVDPGDSIVRVMSKGMRGPIGNVRLHDLAIDGGGVLAKAGLIAVLANVGQPDITDVSISNCSVSNSLGLVDGVDVNRCDRIAVRNVSGTGLNVGVAVVGSHATVDSVTGTDCRAPAFAYGDPTYQTTDIHECLATHIVARDCGKAYGSVSGSGIGVFRAGSTRTTDIVFQDVDSTDTTGHSQRFGLGVAEGVQRVKVVRGRLHGFQAPVRIMTSPPEVTIEGVVGVQ